MTDRELLELAAKAAGFDGHLNPAGVGFLVPCGMTPFGVGYTEWNPLTNDGDALRLAVELQLDILQFGILMARVQYDAGEIKVFDERHDNDAYKATRRAIVRAAAEIGKTK